MLNRRSSLKNYLSQASVSLLPWRLHLTFTLEFWFEVNLATLDISQ
jgi:hypothetical protein